ncbi:hypothetical protein [Desulfovirgula thermocuniculi]|uniref:hypothetical protein n=1 Tax=Desulfovirgula thermocuniculi TaxID=348842 RepID=UPI0003FE65E0|nr:hypothetical protein [Desulfovirgula thermocuniculi]
MEADCAVLRKLVAWALSENPKMRWHAVRHPGCPEDLALYLVDDPDPQVRLGALCRLVLCGSVDRRKAGEMAGPGAQLDALLGLLGNKRSWEGKNGSERAQGGRGHHG